MDNGPGFAGKTQDVWAYRNGVQLHFIRPGKPVENAYIESFNNWFVDLEDAKSKIETWRLDYNRFRAHSRLGDLTPEEFKNKTQWPTLQMAQ